MLKKLMAVVLVGLLTIGSMAMMTTAAVDFQTQYNLSFEQTTESDTVLLPDGWTIGENLSSDEATNNFAVASDEQFKEGNYSLKIKHTSIGNVNDRVWRVVSDLTEGAEYMVTGYVYVTATIKNLGILVFNGTTGGNGTSWHSGLSGTTGVLDEAKQTKEVWMPLTAYFTAPVGGNVSLAVGAYNSDSTFGTAYFDKLAIYELGDGLSFENIKLEDDVLLPSDWTIGSNLSTDENSNDFAVLSTERVRSGNYSLMMKSSRLDPGYRPYTVITGLTEGAAYMVTGYMNVTAPMSNAGILVYAGNTGGAGWTSAQNISSAPVLNETAQITAGSNKWIPIVSYFTAPAGGVVSLAVAAMNSGSTFGTAYFDDLAITKMADTVGFDVKVLDADSKEVTALNGQAKNVKLLVNGTNMSTTDGKDYTLIYATYSQTGEVTEMTSVALSTGTIPAKVDAATVPGYIKQEVKNINIAAGQTFKVFIFDDMNTLSAAYVHELS